MVSWPQRGRIGMGAGKGGDVKNKKALPVRRAGRLCLVPVPGAVQDASRPGGGTAELPSPAGFSDPWFALTNLELNKPTRPNSQSRVKAGDSGFSITSNAAN